MTKNNNLPLLPDLIAITVSKLEALGYSKKYRGYIKVVYNNLRHYAEEVGAKHMTDKLQEDFARDVYDIDIRGVIPLRDYVVRSTTMLLDMQDTGTISAGKKPNNAFPNKIAPVFDAFFNTTKEGKKDSTLETYRRYIMVIAQYLDGVGINDISEVNKDMVSDFILTLSRYCGSSAKRTVSIFSDFLMFAYENGYMNENISSACMKTRFYHDNRIPSVFSKDEIERMLAQINRETPEGKRDYALLLLASRTALRSCDVIGLKLRNLRFDTDTIEISQNKTGKLLVLPLTEEVGCALLDYLMNARPEVANDYVFLRVRAPFGPYKARTNKLVEKYMIKAGIENLKNRQPGLRALRHSLASGMLENGVSIYEIKDYLGHESTNTTMNYVKIDLHELRKCTLEVPVNV